MIAIQKRVMEPINILINHGADTNAPNEVQAQKYNLKELYRHRIAPYFATGWMDASALCDQ